MVRGGSARGDARGREHDLGHGHGGGTAEKVSAPDNFAVFVRLKSGKKCVVVIEFDSYVASEYLPEENIENVHHTTVTVFEPDAVRDGFPFDYAEYLLENDSNFALDLDVNEENPNSEVVTGETLATTSEKEFPKYRIAQKTNSVNRENDISLKKYEPVKQSRKPKAKKPANEHAFDDAVRRMEEREASDGADEQCAP